MVGDKVKNSSLMRPHPKKRCFKILIGLCALSLVVMVIITKKWTEFKFESSFYLEDDVIKVSSLGNSKKKLTVDELFKRCVQKEQLCEFSEQYSSAADQLFFIETVGSSLKPRAACSVESALRNSNKTVKLVFTGNKINQTDEAMSLLISNYPQLQYYTVDIDRLARGLPVEKIVSQIESSKYRDNNYSNILRALLIYHFGGMYLDSDIIVLKPLNFFINFTVPQSTSSLNNAVLSFSKKHPFIWNYMEVQGNKSLFRPKWGVIGPRAMTEAYQHFTKHQNGSMIEPILVNADYFYPYRPRKTDLDQMFCKNEKPKSYWMDFLDRKKALAVHLWNAYSKNIEIKKGFNNTIFTALAPQNCPVIFESDLMFSTHNSTRQRLDSSAA